MKALQLMSGASYGPAALKVIYQAFDEAWRDIAGNFADDPSEIEAARSSLARALLSVARDDSADVHGLKQEALQRMALRPRREDWS